MEKFMEFLEKAEKSVRIVDHMVYVTFPLIKDKKLLLKILLEEKEAVIHCINSVLQYDYLYKRIVLRKDSDENLRIFREKCAPRYGLTKGEVDLILELFSLVKTFEESSFDFYRGEKVVMLSEDLKMKAVNIEKIKEFLSMSKSFLRKIKNRFLSKI